MTKITDALLRFIAREGGGFDEETYRAIASELLAARNDTKAALRARVAVLEAENVAMREAARWIPTGERLPETDDIVQVACWRPDPSWPSMWLDHFWYCAEIGKWVKKGGIDFEPTYWRPAMPPPPPEQDEGGER